VVIKIQPLRHEGTKKRDMKFKLLSKDSRLGSRYWASTTDL